nr:hypothetical protein [Tanacetum cinerariifolium]
VRLRSTNWRSNGLNDRRNNWLRVQDWRFSRDNQRLDVFGAFVVIRMHHVLSRLGLTFYYWRERRRSSMNRGSLICCSSLSCNTLQILLRIGPCRLCAQAQSGDDTPFHKQAFMEYTQLVFLIALASPFGFGIVLLGFEFALRNRVLLWRCLKIRALRWTVLIDSSLVRANENKGKGQVDLEAGSHGVVGRGVWHCFGVEYQLEDIFTKALGRERTDFLINKLGMRSFTSETLQQLTDEIDKIPNQQFDELPFEEEILAFLRELGHSGVIKMITDVNINKLHQPWRSFAAVINKCLSGKSTGYDSVRLSQAQILWGMYHKKNVDFTYLLWEDFVYQVEHKDAKKSNEMYYPRFTKVIVNFFMTKDQSILSRNKYGVILPIELTNEVIKNLESYKEYYDIASGAEPPKTKASVKKKQSSSDTKVPPLTAKGKRLKTSAKMKLATKLILTQTHISHASGTSADEGTGIILGVPDVPTYEYDDEEISWKSSEDDDDDDDDDEEKISKHDDDVNDQSDDDDQDDNDDEQTDSDNDGDDFVHPKFSTHDEEDKYEESFDPIVQTPSQVENTDDEDNDEDSHVRDVQMVDVQTTQVIEDTYVTLTSVNPKGQQQSSSVSSRFVSNMLNPSPDTGIDSIFESTARVDVPVMTTEFMRTNQFAKAICLIPGIVDKYLDHRMNKSVKVAIRLQSDRLQDEAQAENENFLNKLDENIQKIIKEQVKEQVKVQVSKILPKIEKAVNEQLEAEVLTRLSNSSKTSHAVAADLSELELKKILIDKMESNNNLAKKADSRTSFNEVIDTPVYFSAFVMNRLKVDTLTPELLVGRCVIPFDHLINNDLEYLRGDASSQKYTTLVTKTKAADYGHIKWIEDLVPRTMWIKYRIIAVKELQIIEWHNYKYLDWITVRRDDDKLYKFKEGVKSYQKKLNLTKLDTYRSDLKRKEAYTTYSNPKGFIYQNKDKQNRLMRIDELHKFSDGTLNDVQTALNDRLKGIWMEYLPQTIWRRSDKNRAAAMIQAIDKQLKRRRIMLSLEKFVGGRFYKAVRRMYSNPMIQPEPEGSTQGYPLVSVEVLRKIHTLVGNPVKEILLKMNLLDHMSILTDSQDT